MHRFGDGGTFDNEMGLLTIARKQKLKDNEIRMLVLGLDNSGKTTIITRLMGQDTGQVFPTIGFQIHTLAWGEYNISAWDVGGQTTLRGFWSNYFDKLDVIVWVIDSSSIERLEELYQELREKVILQDQLVGTYFCVMINKIDLVGEEQRDEIRYAVEQRLGLLRELPSEKYTIQMVSGVSGEGLEAVMEWVVGKDY